MRRLVAMAGCLALLGGQGAAAAPTTVAPAASAAPAAAAGPLPANSVRCVYEGLTIEDKEITLLLIGLDFLSRGRYARVAPENKIVDRLVLEALPRCSQAYRWSPAAASAAVAHAHTLLVLEVLRQALAYEDFKSDPIDSYYRDNRASLAGKTELDDLMEEGFATFLKGKGWKESDRGPRRLAKVYLEVLIARDSTEGAFARSQTTRVPVRRPKPRAGTASRGRS